MTRAVSPEEPESSIPISYEDQQPAALDGDADAVDDIENGPLLSAIETTTADDEESTTSDNDGHSRSSDFSSSSRWCCVYVCDTVKSSLCCASTTPLLISMLIPVLALFTHVVFLHGQTAPMWRLKYSAHVDVWANATSLEARSTFYTLGLDRDLHYSIQEDRDLRTFTYGYAITELWEAAHMPGKLLPRIAAVLLVVFSGIWPHLKLFILSLTWLFAVNMKRRTRILHWLSTLGKWSLADVLVVCLMLAVLHMDWQVDPTSIKEGLVAEVPLLLRLVQNLYSATEICSHFLHKDCASPPSTFDIAKCASCRNFVTTALDHPDASQATFKSIASGVNESGSGFVFIRVQGMNGIYSFCVAVILSIVLSLVVDVYDARANRVADRELLQEEVEEVSILSDGLLVPLLAVEEPDLSRQLEGRGHRGRPGFFSRYRQCATVSFSVITAALVFAAMSMNTLERRVTGAGPKILHDILGINWDRSFSLQSLARTTGEASGWDSLLMGTLILFLVLGPALRAILCVVAFSIPALPPVHRRRFLTTLDAIGAFCAWEVVAIASYLVSLLIPSTTSTIFMKPLAECAVVSPDSGSCLTVFFDPNDNFALIIVGGVLLVIVAQLPAVMMPRL